MTSVRRRATKRRAWVTAICLAGSIVAGPGAVARLFADRVETAGGEAVEGTVKSIADGKIVVELGGKPASTRTFPLIDLIRVTFVPSFDRAHRCVPLIDNDRAGAGRSLSGTIKLRKGYHRIVVPYWHGDGRTLLRLQYSFRSGARHRDLRIVPPSLLFHIDAQGSEKPSPGLDKQGYRLPEVLVGAKPMLQYTVRRRNGGAFTGIGDLLKANVVVNSGTLDRITPKPFPDEQQQLALLLVGYLRIMDDGEYTLLLSSDGGSQLYLGAAPPGLLQIDGSRPRAPWSLTLTDGGNITGTLETWRDSKLGMTVSAGARTSLSIPVERVAEVWSNPLGKDERVDRSNLPEKEDMVFARAASGRLQRVPGLVQGIEGDSLVLRFGGTDRKIAMQKVAGIIRAAASAAAGSEHRFHQVLETSAGLKLPVEVASLDDRELKFRTLWGQELRMSPDDITLLSMRNGKVVSLTDLSPSRVEQVPFFDRLVPYRLNESLSGRPIQLRDRTCRRGISVHARTVLEYKLDKAYERFRASVGFQIPEGMLGDAAVRVTADGKPLFERASLRGDGPVEPIDVDVRGVNTLALVVDFGSGEDVGDRVVWAEPILLRADVKPPAAAGKSAAN